MKYSIGDFAKKLGVTPDLIKYCVKVGILTPDISENGYRSFDFNQSTGVIEYIKMQNLGYSANEIKGLMQDEEAFGGIVQQCNELREKTMSAIKFQTELLKYYDFISYVSPLIHKGKCWEVKNVPGMYFLPHFNGLTFQDEKEFADTLRKWMSYLPVVTSAMHTSHYSADIKKRWGFIAPKLSAENLGLAASRFVEYIPPCRALVTYGYDHVYRSGEKLYDYTFSVLDKLGFENINDIYYLVLSRNGPIEDHINYGMIIIPLELLQE